MHKLNFFGLGLLMSTICLTGFGHVGLFLTAIIFFLVVLYVKNLLTRCRRQYFLFGSLVGGVIFFFSYSLLSEEKIPLTEGSVLQVQVLGRYKPNTVSTRIISSGALTDYYLLVESDILDYVPGTYIQLVVKKSTQAYFPGYTFFGDVYRYPSTFDYGRRLAMKGYCGHVMTYSHTKLSDTFSVSGGGESRQTNISEYFHTRIYKTYSSKSAGLLEGMLLGGRSGLHKDVYEDFLNSGLVHIIAVSGSNIMMLVVLLSALLFWMPFYCRIVLTILTIFVYSILAGLDSSVLRALVMGTLVLLSLLVGKRVNIWRSLWYACIILVCFNPWVVLYDLGFVLSFGALIGMLLLDRFITSLGYTSKVVKYSLPCFGATLGTLPALILIVGGINILSPFVNIIVVFFVPIILLLGIIGVFFGGLFVTVLEYMMSLLFSLASWTATYGIFLEVQTAVSKVMLLLVGILLVGGIKMALSVIVDNKEQIRT